jgi:hypothetical protein
MKQETFYTVQFNYKAEEGSDLVGLAARKCKDIYDLSFEELMPLVQTKTVPTMEFDGETYKDINVLKVMRYTNPHTEVLKIRQDLYDMIDQHGIIKSEGVEESKRMGVYDVKMQHYKGEDVTGLLYNLREYD